MGKAKTESTADKVKILDFIGTGMLIQHFEEEIIFAISPHPDDLSIGPGGTLFNLCKTGKTICPLYFTMGARGVTEDYLKKKGITAVKIREEESNEECNILFNDKNCGSKLNLGFYDKMTPDKIGSLTKRIILNDLGKIKLKINEKIGEHEPDEPEKANKGLIVFLPTVYDGHDTHRLCSLLTLLTLYKFLKEDGDGKTTIRLLFYESPWGQIHPKKISVISPLSKTAIEAKVMAAKAHKSQTYRSRYEDIVRGLAVYRAAQIPELIGGLGSASIYLGEWVEVFSEIVVNDFETLKAEILVFLSKEEENAILFFENREEDLYKKHRAYCELLREIASEVAGIETGKKKK